MSWLYRTARRLLPRRRSPVPSAEAEAARAEATAALSQVRSQWPRVRSTTEYLMRAGDRNHFTGAMERLFRNGA